MDKGRLIYCITCVLVVGEMFGGVISRPLAAIGTWIPKKTQITNNYASAEAVSELFDVMNKRICDLEERA